LWEAEGGGRVEGWIGEGEYGKNVGFVGLVAGVRAWGLGGAEDGHRVWVIRGLVDMGPIGGS